MRIKKSSRGIYEPVQSEEDVLGAIRQLLEANGGHVHRFIERIPWGRTTSEPGVPDLMIVWPNVPWDARVMFIEVKRKGGKLRPAQEQWIRRVREDGVICFMADSVESMVEQCKQYGITIRGLQ